MKIQKFKYRREFPQVVAVCIKNLLFFTYALTVGFLTILIPSLSGRDPSEKIHLDEETVSWLSKYFDVTVFLFVIIN